MWSDRPRHSAATCARLLNRLLLPPGELLEVLAPEGWERSTLVGVFHPSPEQLAVEREQFRRNLAILRGTRHNAAADGKNESHDRVEDPAPGETQREPPAPIDPQQEVVELLGHALWDVFSNNHTVVDPEGTAYDLGSFRGSAGFIAESINRRYGDLNCQYDYLDFYMGSSWSAGRADLQPVYRWIFGRLKDAGCSWIYSFPRIYLVEFGRSTEVDDPTAYDPSEAVRAELEGPGQAETADSLADQLERGYEEDMRRARRAPLPPAVAAYRDVFGHLPDGWPHPEM
jgi:hypothetical protein